MLLLSETYDGKPFYDESYFKPGLYIAEFPALTGAKNISYPQVKPQNCDPADYGDPLEEAVGICFPEKADAYNGQPVQWRTEVQMGGSISFEWCHNASTKVTCQP